MGRCSDAKERLLGSAARLLHARGYSALSVADLCDDAGLKKGSFYHFFASKQELVLATIDRYGEDMKCRHAAAKAAATSARARLEWIFGQLETDLKDTWSTCGCVRGCPIGNLALEMADQDEAIRRKLQSLFDTWRQGLEEILREGIARGEFSLPDPHRTATQLVAYFEGSVMLAKASNDPGVFCALRAGILSLLSAEASPMVEVAAP